MIGRTVIVIAHRLSTIKNANQIAVINEGKIAELGAYEDLMQIEEGLFRKLVERQTITNGLWSKFNKSHCLLYLIYK